jgi:hypothetical protein
MADLKLKIVVLDTHDVESILIADATAYLEEPPLVTSPTLVITAPGFLSTSVPFNVQGYNLLTSDIFGITPPGEIADLPDGLYEFTYSVAPSATSFVTIAFMRVNQLQEKFDKAFMSLDFMVCDNAIKTQAKVTLNTIYLLIQGAIAAANECALIESNKLYDKANAMLETLLKKNCGCTGNHFIVNFN